MPRTGDGGRTMVLPVKTRPLAINPIILLHSIKANDQIIVMYKTYIYEQSMYLDIVNIYRCSVLSVVYCGLLY